MYQRQVSFVEAIKMALTTNYCNFNGRSSRSEYWWYCLFTFILGIVLTLIFGDGTVGRIVSGVVNLALFLPGLGLAVRRLHDIDKTGWWVLIAFTVIGVFLLIYWAILDSQKGANKYGPVPNVTNA